MPNAGSAASYDEEQNTYLLSGPEFRDLVSYGISTVLVIGVLQIVSMCSKSEGILCVLAAVLTITQGLYHMYEKNTYVTSSTLDDQLKKGGAATSFFTTNKDAADVKSKDD